MNYNFAIGPWQWKCVSSFLGQVLYFLRTLWLCQVPKLVGAKGSLRHFWSLEQLADGCIWLVRYNLTCAFSALTLLFGRQEGHLVCKILIGMVIWLERGADLHMAQLMPLPLTVSCFSKIQNCFSFLVPTHPGSPGQRAVCVCVCVCACVRVCVRACVRAWVCVCYRAAFTRQCS